MTATPQLLVGDAGVHIVCPADLSQEMRRQFKHRKVDCVISNGVSEDRHKLDFVRPWNLEVIVELFYGWHANEFRRLRETKAAKAKLAG